jgi:2-methylcitrate dehydratase PrpD
MGRLFQVKEEEGSSMNAQDPSALSYALAQLVERIQSARLEGGFRRSIRQHLLDALASAFIGFRSPTFHNLARLCPRVRDGCSWLGGRKERIHPLDAAMVWAAAINGSVFEDGSREGACHPASVVFPTILALAEGKDWEQIERAVVAGYDVMIRMARAGNPEFTRRGFHPTAIVAPFGAAAAAASLLGYDPFQTQNALCLAAQGGAGLMASFRSGETQPLQVGWSARSGLAAARLAGMGAAGYPKILEEGFYPAYLGSQPHIPVDHPLEFEYALQGSYLKIYPGCRHIHPALDAFDRVLKDKAVDLPRVEKIQVRTYRVAVETEIHEIHNRGDAYFNIPYALAARGVLGKADWEAFGEEHFKNASLLELMKKVTVLADPEWEGRYPRQRGAGVEVILRDGTVLSAQVDYALGEPENPLPPERTREKFRSTAGKFLDPGMMERMESLLDGVRMKESAKSLFDALSENVRE